MPLEIRWKASLSATCLHAVACRREGLAAADPQLEQVVGEAADALIAEIGNAPWPVDAVVDTLAGLASEYENNRELVTRCAVRLDLPPADTVRIAGAIADLETALLRARPELVDELAVRGRPLREQWEARGPGLLREAARLMEEAVVPPSAEVVLAAPYVGGHGMAHAAWNRIIFEAVLVNPLPELPETVRLAWLACQLNSDLPRYAEPLPAGAAARSFRLATIPAVLAAAESVELVRGDVATIDYALDAWRLRTGLPDDAGQRLSQWWQAWLELPKSWPVAVAALDQLLG